MKSPTNWPITKVTNQIIVSSVIVVVLFVLTLAGIETDVISQWLEYLYGKEVLTQMPVEEAIYLLIILIVGYVTRPRIDDIPVE